MAENESATSDLKGGAKEPLTGLRDFALLLEANETLGNPIDSSSN